MFLDMCFVRSLEKRIFKNIDIDFESFECEIIWLCNVLGKAAKLVFVARIKTSIVLNVVLVLKPEQVNDSAKRRKKGNNYFVASYYTTTSRVTCSF